MNSTSHRFPEETPEAPKDAITLARDAIAHTLHAICQSPAKYWLLGNGTESYAQLTAAYAALRNQPVEEVRAYFQPDKEEYEAFKAQRRADQEALELVATLSEHGGTTDAVQLAELVSLGLHVRASNRISALDGGGS